MVPMESSLIDNIVYRIYLPNAVIIISVVYISSYLIQSITKLYHQRQKRIERQERQRLKAVYHSSSSSSSLTLYSHHLDHSTENTYFWTRQQKKRLQLLWNWSVAMGYCEYSHGKELNALIEMLLKERNGT
ncbi:hypothetical protein AB4K20DRAFT_1877959 [Rhizopus microsporus]